MHHLSPSAPDTPAAPSGRVRPRPALAVLALALAGAAVVGSPAFARPAPQSFADLVEKVAPAVVTVATERKTAAESAPQATPDMPLPPDSRFREFFDRFFDRDQMDREAPRGREHRAQALGSGFILDGEGTVVTNSHVVAGASSITVTLKDGETFEAALLGRDEKSDLAVLKIDSDERLPFVTFGDSDKVRVGDWVMAVGNPFGLGGTVTAGIVSARGRDISGALVDFLQIDAAINQGNSGGPAFNDAGEVVGINTAIFTPNGGSVGIGFAIPSNMAAQIVADLKDDGRVERGWFGVQIQPVTPEIAEGFGLDDARGALIAAVEPDSPAAKAGVQAGDVVLSWNGAAVEDPRDLAQQVAATKPGDRVSVQLWRDRAERGLSVETGTMPTAEQVAAAPAVEQPAAGASSVPGTGLTLSELTPELRSRFAVDPAVSGVLITKVEDGSPAGDQGLRRGDVILSVDLVPVESLDQAVERLDSLRDAGREVVPLMVSREGRQGFYPLRLADA